MEITDVPASAEHIELASEADDEPRWTRTTGELVQRSRLDGSRTHLRIFNERYASVSVRRVLCRARTYWVDLRCLEPRPRRVIRIAWLCAGLGVGLFAAATTLSMSIGQASGALLSRPALPVALGLYSGATLALAVAVYRSSWRWVWQSRHGGVALVEIAPALPDRRTVQAFAGELTRCAERAEVLTPVRGPQGLSAELCEHRRLAQAGILSPRDYAQAKARILHHHGLGS